MDYGETQYARFDSTKAPIFEQPTVLDGTSFI